MPSLIGLINISVMHLSSLCLNERISASYISERLQKRLPACKYIDNIKLLLNKSLIKIKKYDILGMSSNNYSNWRL